MSQQLTKSEIKHLATRWREYQESITGQRSPSVPRHLQAIADHCDAGLLLSSKPELAQPQRSEVISHV